MSGRHILFPVLAREPSFIFLCHYRFLVSTIGLEPRQNVTEATTAVLEYASFILHKPSHCKDSNSSGENCRRASGPHLVARRMDDAVPLDAYETLVHPAVAVTTSMSPQERRGHRRVRVSTNHDGVVNRGKAERIWQADELYTKEAVAAAGRKARVSLDKGKGYTIVLALCW